MQLFSQRDSQWSQMKLGTSNLTLGRYGCTTVCLSMLSSYFTPTLTPDQVCQHIKYTPDGLIIWQSCDFEKFKFSGRYKGRTDQAIQQALKDTNRACILEVQSSHWVVAVGKTLFGNAYKIADPWTGRYGTTNDYKNDITGFALFIRK